MPTQSYHAGLEAIVTINNIDYNANDVNFTSDVATSAVTSSADWSTVYKMAGYNEIPVQCTNTIEVTISSDDTNDIRDAIPFGGITTNVTLVKYRGLTKGVTGLALVKSLGYSSGGATGHQGERVSITFKGFPTPLS